MQPQTSSPQPAADRPLPRGCRLIQLPDVVDERGGLCFAEAERHIPFAIRRVFWIHDVPEGRSRGSHSHNTCAEVVFAAMGAFTMVVDDGRTRARIRIDKVNEGILIPAGVWCELEDFAPQTLLVVFASQAYDAAGYVNDYASWKQKNA